MDDFYNGMRIFYKLFLLNINFKDYLLRLNCEYFIQ